MSWLDSLGLPYVAYQHSDPSQPHYHRDLANEAAAYLQFVIDYYNCLPQVCPHSTLPLWIEALAFDLADSKHFSQVSAKATEYDVASLSRLFSSAAREPPLNTRDA